MAEISVASGGVRSVARIMICHQSGLLMEKYPQGAAQVRSDPAWCHVVVKAAARV